MIFIYLWWLIYTELLLNLFQFFFQLFSPRCLNYDQNEVKLYHLPVGYFLRVWMQRSFKYKISHFSLVVRHILLSVTKKPFYLFGIIFYVQFLLFCIIKNDSQYIFILIYCSSYFQFCCFFKKAKESTLLQQSKTCLAYLYAVLKAYKMLCVHP